MKKIIIVTDSWAPAINGVSVTLEKMREIGESKGYKVKIIHPGLVNFFTLPYLPEIPISFFPGYIIKKIIENEKPDHIHIATEGQLGFTARKICIKKNLFFTTSYHTNFAMYAEARIGKIFFRMINSYIFWFHKAAAATMVSTQSLKKELIKNGLTNILIWPLGVDTDLFQMSDQKSNLFARPIYIYVGRIAKEKNVEEYLKCDLQGTKLVIGDGPQRKELEKRYKDKAVFLGYKKRQDLVDVIAQSDVLVFPSITDTFGLIIVEALACGIPVAAHNVMGPKDILTEGVDGFMEENLSDAAKKCLTLSAKACREKALLFSWQNSAEIFLRNLK